MRRNLEGWKLIYVVDILRGGLNAEKGERAFLWDKNAIVFHKCAW